MLNVKVGWYQLKLTSLSKKVKCVDMRIKNFKYSKFTKNRVIIKILPCGNGRVKIFYLDTKSGIIF